MEGCNIGQRRADYILGADPFNTAKNNFRFGLRSAGAFPVLRVAVFRCIFPFVWTPTQIVCCHLTLQTLPAAVTGYRVSLAASCYVCCELPPQTSLDTYNHLVASLHWAHSCCMTEVAAWFLTDLFPCFRDALRPCCTDTPMLMSKFFQ